MVNVRNGVFFCMKTKAEDKNSHEIRGINKYRLDMKLLEEINSRLLIGKGQEGGWGGIVTLGMFM